MSYSGLSFLSPLLTATFSSLSIMGPITSSSLSWSSSGIISVSQTGSSLPSTCVISSSSKARVKWKIPSQALKWDKKTFHRPCPLWAPFTRPAISTTFRKAGILLAGLWYWQRKSNLSSGTGTLLSFGSTVQNGKFSAEAWLLVSTLKKVDFPTFGIPTIPIFKEVPNLPMMGVV